MGFTVTIEGNEKTFYGEDIIQMAQMALTSPDNSRARASKNDVTVHILGKLHADADGGKNSTTLKLAQWAQVPAEQEQDAYRQATVEVIHDGQCFRKIMLSKAFVVDYSERYSDNKGVGDFSLTIRQKADIQNEVKIDGGLPLDDAADTSDSDGPPDGLTPSAPTGAVPGLAASLEQSAAAMALNKLDPSGIAAALAGAGMAGMGSGTAGNMGDVITRMSQTTGITGLENSMSQETVAEKINNLYAGHTADMRGEFANPENRTAGAPELNTLKQAAVSEERLTTGPTGISKELTK